MDARDRLEALLRDRIVVLDGSWGVLIQRDVRGRGGLPRRALRATIRATSPAIPTCSTSRGRRSCSTSTARTSRPAPTSPRRTRSRRRRSARPTTGSRTTPREMSLEGARLARQAADEFGGFVAGSVGPLNVTLSLSPKVDDPAYRAVTFDEVRERVRGADRGARRGRRRPPADRDDLRHAEREGRDRRRAGGRAASCRSGSRSPPSTSAGATSRGRRWRRSGRRSSTRSR